MGRCKMVVIEDASGSTLTNASEQAVHALKNTATQFAANPSTLAVTNSSYVWICTRTNDGIQEGLEDSMLHKGGSK
jgi:hypothetical protein